MRQKFYEKPVSKNTKQMNMNCSTVRKKMIYYADGETSSHESEKIRQHLANCMACDHLYRQLQSTLEVADHRKQLESNPYLYTRIKAQLESAQKENIVLNTPVYKKILRPVLMTLILIIGLYGGNRLGNFYDASQAQVTTTQSTEYYLDDLQQERLEVILLND